MEWREEENQAYIAINKEADFEDQQKIFQVVNMEESHKSTLEKNNHKMRQLKSSPSTSPCRHKDDISAIAHLSEA